MRNVFAVLVALFAVACGNGDTTGPSVVDEGIPGNYVLVEVDDVKGTQLPYLLYEDTWLDSAYLTLRPDSTGVSLKYVTERGASKVGVRNFVWHIEGDSIIFNDKTVAAIKGKDYWDRNDCLVRTSTEHTTNVLTLVRRTSSCAYYDLHIEYYRKER